jgi:hypothetical protein
MDASRLNALTESIIGAAIDVHKELGPGLLDQGYRIDLLVEDQVIVEIKSIERFERVHVAQLISYLKFANRQVGLLLNFNVTFLSRNGIKRVVNGSPE